MQAFKAGTREATIMHQIAKGYTDEQVKQMADYFANQKP
jgi:cytochrome c553